MIAQTKAIMSYYYLYWFRKLIMCFGLKAMRSHIELHFMDNSLRDDYFGLASKTRDAPRDFFSITIVLRMDSITWSQ